MLLPYRLDYYGFVVSSEIEKSEPSYFVLFFFFLDCLATLGPL